MDKGLLFWVIFVVCLIFGGFGAVPQGRPYWDRWGFLVFFLMIGLLGWAVFGPVVR